MFAEREDLIMNLFGFGLKKKIEQLEEENREKDKRIDELEDLCDEKDDYFKELMSDALRHGSSLAGKHMSDKKKYNNGK